VLKTVIRKLANVRNKLCTPGRTAKLASFCLVNRGNDNLVQLQSTIIVWPATSRTGY